MGGKWGQYTPEELACFKSGRMYAYLDDEKCRKHKNAYSRERQARLYKESPEFREAHARYGRAYYERHKAELKIQREAANLIKEAKKKQISEALQKRREEQRLKREAREQEQEKRRALRQRIQESKTLKEARESLTKKAKKHEIPPKRIRKNKIPEQRVFEFPTVSHTVIMD
jgi:hypothetical protein